MAPYIPNGAIQTNGMMQPTRSDPRPVAIPITPRSVLYGDKASPALRISVDWPRIDAASRRPMRIAGIA